MSTTLAPSFQCDRCWQTIGLNASHWVLPDRRVLCSECVDRLGIYDEPRLIGDREFVAAQLGRLGPTEMPDYPEDPPVSNHSKAKALDCASRHDCSPDFPHDDAQPTSPSNARQNSWSSQTKRNSR
jgi:hypothetical protein